jgi:hypothetical protein
VLEPLLLCGCYEFGNLCLGCPKWVLGVLGAVGCTMCVGAPNALGRALFVRWEP